MSHTTDGRKYVNVERIKVYIVKGNITDEQVDVIVNSTNTDLDLSKGKASAALLTAAGSEVQSECREKYPKGFQQGAVAQTGPGQLGCKEIYHCALPKYNDDEQEKVLWKQITTCLVTADSSGYQTIALPAFGTGLLGYPADISAKIILQSIADFSRKNPRGSLHSVVIVIYSQDSNTFKAFLQEVRTISSVSSTQGIQPGVHSSQQSGSSCFPIGRITVLVELGKLPDYCADVLVCSGSNDLQLDHGKLSKALLEAAGPELQEECEQEYEDGIEFGEVAMLKGYHLKCNRVYVGALPKWESTNPDPVQILKTFLSKCLEQADKNKAKVIAVPTLGTGSLKYPPNKVAKAIVECIQEFESNMSTVHLKKIIIVVYDGSSDSNVVHTEFYNALEKFLPKSRLSRHSSRPAIKRTVASSPVGELTVKIEIDDIANQKTDVIVNSTSPNLNLAKGSSLAKSLLKKGGQTLQSELDQSHPHGISAGDLAVTKGGNMSCKEVYHGTIPSFYSKQKGGKKPEDILEIFVSDCLKRAEGSQHSSIALPALGTGYLKFPPDVSATHMLKAISSFAGSSKFIKQVEIIVYDDNQTKELEEAFRQELQAASSANQPAQNHVPNPSRPSPKGPPPKKGSKEYIKWMYTRPLYPPSTWSHYTSKHSLKSWNLKCKSHEFQMTDPDATIVQSIKSAFTKTVGTNYNIQSIKRIENVDLFLKYGEECQRLFRKVKDITPIDTMPGSRGQIKTMQLLDPSFTKHLHGEINEFYVFHGTKPQYVDPINNQGLDSRLAAAGRLGSGVYGAEIASKSAQYIGSDKNGCFYMYLIRVCLGDVYLTTRGGNFKRPPCKTCSSDVCHQHFEYYESVVADGGAFSDREFVVYDKNQSYPEYLITFK